MENFAIAFKILSEIATKSSIKLYTHVCSSVAFYAVKQNISLSKQFLDKEELEDITVFVVGTKQETIEAIKNVVGDSAQITEAKWDIALTDTYQNEAIYHGESFKSNKNFFIIFRFDDTDSLETLSDDVVLLDGIFVDKKERLIERYQNSSESIRKELDTFLTSSEN